MDDDFGLLNEKEKAFVDSFTEKIRNQERERILEALGTCPCKCPQDNCECGCGEEPEFTRNELIWIIKGETSE